AHVNRGNLLLGDARRRPDAVGDYQQALNLLDRLVKDFPAVPRYKYELANCHNSLGSALAQDKGRRAEAEKEWLLALPIFQELVGRKAAGADYHYGLGMTLGNLGWLYLQRKELAVARTHLEKGIDGLKEALKPNPEHPAYLVALRNQHRDLAETLLQLGEH